MDEVTLASTILSAGAVATIGTAKLIDKVFPKSRGKRECPILDNVDVRIFAREAMKSLHDLLEEMRTVREALVEQRADHRVQQGKIEDLERRVAKNESAISH